jgi:lysyl-tRNA synthetase, class I
MIWIEELLKQLPEAAIQVVNDSKTPSGRAHIGSMRGPLVHDVAYRALVQQGIAVRYTFGVDDYDPLDEAIPEYGDYYQAYRGVPLCNAPAPPGSPYPDLAQHFISDFFSVFDDLGIATERYYMRDIYRNGEFNEAIDQILKRADTVREIYLKVSKSRKNANWFPLQVICEQCGKIGTTEVIGYENGEVEYHCRPNLVEWAQGCGHHGKMDPMNGRAKLPWKLEWTAKWAFRGVSIEGAGKDHGTKGGSRDVAAACLQAIFGKKPPVNIPYEFFVVEGGAKMSSSKGLGTKARDLADLLPPEILRYLVIRNQPRQPVSFSSNEAKITKLFFDFDQLRTKVFSDAPDVEAFEREIFQWSELQFPEAFYVESYSMLITLIQLPNIDVEKAVEKRKGSPLTDTERQYLVRRVASARVWLEHYTEPEERMELQAQLPPQSAELTAVQRYFLHQLADAVQSLHEQQQWNEEALSQALFDVARQVPCKPADGYKALYRVILDKTQGPRAATLLYYLDLPFLLERLRALDYDQAAFYTQTAESPEALMAWYETAKADISQLTTGNVIALPASEGQPAMHILEIRFLNAEQKPALRRVMWPVEANSSTTVELLISTFVDKLNN